MSGKGSEGWREGERERVRERDGESERETYMKMESLSTTHAGSLKGKP